jgi:hypothetical protein
VEAVMIARSFSEKLTEYAITVRTWAYYYSYIAEPRTRHEVDEFIHLETLELHGALTGLHDRKALSVKIMIACEKVRVDGDPSRYDRPVLGNLDMKSKSLEAYLLLPAAHVTRLVTVAASDRIEYVRLSATRMFRGRALVRSVNVVTRI